MRLLPVPMSLREANDFVSTHHRHSKRTSRDGGKFAVGVSDGDSCWGVAIVGRPLSRIIAGDPGVAEVLRCCTREGAPLGANSFLYGACWRAWRALGGTKLVTYTLQRESGASLRGAGWSVVAEIKPRDWTERQDASHRVWQSVYNEPKLRWEIAG